MEVTMQKIAPKKVTYKLKAKDPEALVTEMNKRDHAGEFAFDIGATRISVNKDGSVKQLKLAAKTQLTMPVWATYSKQSAKAKKEWDRFYKCLDFHERGHKLILMESFAKIAEKARQLEAERVAAGNILTAKELQQTIMNDWFTPVIDKPQDVYDDKTKHGATQGAVFRSANC
ncbi:MAG: DUF922 domain-containing protein [Pseudomonadota bacterium]